VKLNHVSFIAEGRDPKHPIVFVLIVFDYLR